MGSNPFELPVHRSERSLRRASVEPLDLKALCEVSTGASKWRSPRGGQVSQSSSSPQVLKSTINREDLGRGGQCPFTAHITAQACCTRNQDKGLLLRSVPFYLWYWLQFEDRGRQTYLAQINQSSKVGKFKTRLLKGEELAGSKSEYSGKKAKVVGRAHRNLGRSAVV